MKDFTWQKFCDQALEHRIKRFKILASRPEGNPDFKEEHPDWFREGQKNDFTVMIKKLTTSHNNNISKYYNRREKTGLV